MKTPMSSHYQYKYHESIMSDLYWALLTQPSNSLTSLDKEQLYALEAKLKDIFWSIANQHITKRQKQIIILLLDGYTQQEIADELGLKSQSSISLHISGKRGKTSSRSVLDMILPHLINNECIIDLLNEIYLLLEQVANDDNDIGISLPYYTALNNLLADSL